MSETSSRRAQQRHDIQIQVEVAHAGQTYQVVTRNISLGGMFLLLAAQIPFGDQVQLTFELPDLDTPVVAQGHVRWVQPGQGVGVQFAGLRAREVWALQQLFGKTPSGSAPPPPPPAP